MSSFIEVAKAGDIPRVQDMLKCGTDVNCVDPKDRSSALYWAACQGHYKLCDLLIRTGADINQPVRWGSLPIHGAADRGRADCLTLLLASKSNIAAQNENLDTPLHLAACRGYLDICKQLLQHGAPLHLTNNQQKTPVDEARSNQHEKVYQLLIQTSLAPICKDIRQFPGAPGGFRNTAPVNHSSSSSSSSSQPTTVPPKPITSPLPLRAPEPHGLNGSEFKNHSSPPPSVTSAEKGERSKLMQSLQDCFEEVGDAKKLNLPTPDTDNNADSRRMDKAGGCAGPLGTDRQPTATDSDSEASDNSCGGFKNSTRSRSSTELRHLAAASSNPSVQSPGRDGKRPSWGSLDDLPNVSLQLQVKGAFTGTVPITSKLSVSRTQSDSAHRHLLQHQQQQRASSPDPIRYQQLKDLVKKLAGRVDQLESERDHLRLQLNLKGDVIETLHKSSTLLNQQLTQEQERNNQLQTEVSLLQDELVQGRRELETSMMHGPAQLEPSWTQSTMYPYSYNERELLGLAPLDGTPRQVFGDEAEWRGEGCSPKQGLISREVETQGVTRPSSPPTVLLVVYSALLSLLRSSGDDILRALCSAVVDILQSTMTAQSQTTPLDSRERPWTLGVDFHLGGEPCLHGGSPPAWTVPVQDKRQHRYNLQISSKFDGDTGWGLLKSIPDHLNIVGILHDYCDSLIAPITGPGEASSESPSFYCVTQDYPCNLGTIIDDIRQCQNADTRTTFLVQVFYQLLSAVEHFSSLGIVHENLTARSVYLDRNLRLVLGDWHMARRQHWDNVQDQQLSSSENIAAKTDLLAASLLLQDLLNCDRQLTDKASPEGHVVTQASPGRSSLRFKSLVEECVLGNLDVNQARLRVGMLLFGPDCEEMSSQTDAVIWVMSRTLGRLAACTASPSHTGLSDGATRLTLTEAVEVNQNFLESHFLCSVSAEELWKLLQTYGRST